MLLGMFLHVTPAPAQREHKANNNKMTHVALLR